MKLPADVHDYPRLPAGHPIRGMNQVIERVRAALPEVNVPTHYDRIYKDECVYSFCTPESADGLYVCMKSWQGVGEPYLELHRQRTGSCLYYHERHVRVPLPQKELENNGVPTKMAIGGTDGFQVGEENFKVERHLSVVVLAAEKEVIPLPCPDLPEKALQIIATIQAHEGTRKRDQVLEWEEDRKESRYAKDLVQLPADWRISMNPSDWKCSFTGVTDNLWLNLSTGKIGSGRQQFDGSGGNGSALRHYEETGRRYPLAVKLGTITPQGADVYSYAADEDDLVIDPLLPQHLAHWGIDVSKLEKTAKTMAELQVDLNIKFEYNAITEGGQELKPVTGPGLVGLSNLGNYCFMSSVLQALWGVPALAQTYVARRDAVLRSAPADITADFPAQFAKVGTALVTGQTEKQAYVVADMSEQARLAARIEANTVAPHRFKSVIGHGHRDFSTSQQQDAYLFFSHLLDVMARSERSAADRLPGADVPPCSSLFMFEMETRTQCSTTGAVSYQTASCCGLSLSIPIECATNIREVDEYQTRAEHRCQMKARQADAYITEAQQGALTNEQADEDPVVPLVPMDACIAAFAGESVLQDYYSPALGGKGRAVQTSRMANFPPYLMLHMQKFFLDKDTRERKLDALVDMQHGVNLEGLRAKGPQPEERMQPEDAAEPAEARGTQPDPAIVAALLPFGCSENACARAAVAVKNAGIEAASNWLLEHMGDSDIDDLPPAPVRHKSNISGNHVSPEALMTLSSLGFSAQQAQVALQECDGSVERAADWLYSRQSDLDAEVAKVEGRASPSKRPVLDGEGKYELAAIISHIGSNTACGHYVAHVKKGGQWYIFNDDKVATSERLPVEHGFLYLYRRLDQPWA